VYAPWVAAPFAAASATAIVCACCVALLSALHTLSTLAWGQTMHAQLVLPISHGQHLMIFVEDARHVKHRNDLFGYSLATLCHTRTTTPRVWMAPPVYSAH
jgi:hypothetical protein